MLVAQARARQDHRAQRPGRRCGSPGRSGPAAARPAPASAARRTARAGPCRRWRRSRSRAAEIRRRSAGSSIVGLRGVVSGARLMRPPGRRSRRRSARAARRRPRGLDAGRAARLPSRRSTDQRVVVALEAAARDADVVRRRSGRAPCAASLSRAYGSRSSVSAAKPTTSARTARHARRLRPARRACAPAAAVRRRRRDLLDLRVAAPARACSRRPRRRRCRRPAGNAASTASRICAARRTSMRAHAGGRGQMRPGPATSVDLGAHRRGRGGDREAHLAAAAVAEEAHRIEVLEGRAGADQHPARRRARAARASAQRGDDFAAARACGRRRLRRRPGGPSPGPSTCDAARAQQSRRSPASPGAPTSRGSSPAHSDQRRLGRQAQRGEQVVGEAVREPRDECSALAGATRCAWPSARVRYGPSPLRRPRPTARCAPARRSAPGRSRAVTNCCAPSVITTRTSAPASRRRRTRSAAL